MTALSPERLGQLRIAKLTALLGDRFVGGADGVAEAKPLGEGAALRQVDGSAAVLIENADLRSLGGALMWSVRNGATSLTLIVDASREVAGHLARQASRFDFPITVERLGTNSSLPVTAAPYEPVSPEIPADTVEFVDLLRSHGVEVVVEHGVVKGEVLGLEVARVERYDGVAHLEVGVGRFDREISAMMFANVPTAEAMEKAVDMVRKYRAPNGQIHPLRDLVPERWVRTIVAAHPELVGATDLQPIDSTVMPESLRDRQPASLGGHSTAGSSVVVICTAGVDLDLIPLAADTRAEYERAHGVEAELVIAGPERSLIAPTRAVAELLANKPRFVAVELPY